MFFIGAKSVVFGSFASVQNIPKYYIIVIYNGYSIHTGSKSQQSYYIYIAIAIYFVLALYIALSIVPYLIILYYVFIYQKIVL